MCNPAFNVVGEFRSPNFALRALGGGQIVDASQLLVQAVAAVAGLGAIDRDGGLEVELLPNSMRALLSLSPPGIFSGNGANSPRASASSSEDCPFSSFAFS